MKLNGVIWLRDVLDKLATKHAVTSREVEEVLDDAPLFWKLERGRVRGEDLYAALG